MIRITPTARLIGLLGGFLASLVFVVAGWLAFLILLAFTAAGYLVGAFVESPENVGRRVRGAIDRLFRA